MAESDKLDKLIEKLQGVYDACQPHITNLDLILREDRTPAETTSLKRMQLRSQRITNALEVIREFRD